MFELVRARGCIAFADLLELWLTKEEMLRNCYQN
jgi:hypothetical protein